MEYDLLIGGGRVVDGSGLPSYNAVKRLGHTITSRHSSDFATAKKPTCGHYSKICNILAQSICSPELERRSVLRHVLNDRPVAWPLHAAGFQRSDSLFRLAAQSRKYRLMSVRAGIPVSAAIDSKYSTVPSSSRTVTSFFSRLA